MTVPTLVPLFDNSSAIAVPFELALPDISADDATEVHAYVVPATPELKAIDADEPLHTDEDDGVATATGLGLTVTTLVAALPLHKLAVGVTV